MLVVTRDADWERRLRALAVRGGWALESCPALPSFVQSSRDRVLVILDGADLREAAGLRVRHASATIILALTQDEMSPQSLKEAMSMGVDEVLGKDWAEERLFSRLSSFFDQALAAEVRVSSDGKLKAEKRSHRGYVLVRKSWKDLGLHPAEFVLLWRLLAREAQAVSREELLAALKSALSRDFEAETVARRALSLRKALRSWKGTLESVRGGLYRLVSAR